VGLALVPGYRPETCRVVATIGVVLRKDPTNTMDGGINCKVNGAIRLVVDGDKDGRMNDSTFQHLHCCVLLLGPGKGLALVGEED